MRKSEAIKLYTAISLLDPYAKQRTDVELDAIAEQIAAMLPSTDLKWALDFVNASMRNGKVPSLPELAAAWAPEARRRVENVPVPPAPAEIEDDPEQWKAWEKARRAALVGGANPEQAQQYATRQIGGNTARAAIESGGKHVSESAKDNVRAQLRQWAERQRIEQQRLLSNDEGSDQ